jgi:hypothetical protein
MSLKTSLFVAALPPSQVATWERAAGTSRPLQVVVLGE